MVYQSQSNLTLAYKVQSGLGAQASGAGGTILRLAGGAGAQLTKAATESNEVRYDGMRQRGRHGTQKTTGEWTGEMSKGSHEPILEAIMRNTWVAALVLTEASGSLVSITTGANDITCTGAGSWLTLGLRKGDVIRLTNFATSANNDRNLRITNVTATVITVAETLTINAVADTTFTITRPKKLTQYAGSVVTDRYFTVDEWDGDIDQSTILTDFVWSSVKFSMAPNGLLTADPGGVGTGQLAALATGGTSPLLTGPTATTGTPYSVVDATVRLGGVDLVALTALDLTLSIEAMAPDVFGSGAIKYSPDVFRGNASVAMNFSVLRKDLAFLSDFISETEYQLHILAVENETEPKDFFSIYVGNFTLGGNTRSSPGKAGGPLTESISVPAALVGIDSDAASDATMIKFASSY